MKIKVILLFILTLLLNTNKNIAYDRSKIGIFGGVNYNIYLTDFRALPGIPNCCPQFSEGNGLSFHGGLSYEYPISDVFSIGSNIAYYSLKGKLSSVEETTLFYNYQMNTGKFEHIIDLSLSVLSFEPKIGLNIWQGLNFFSGISLSLPLRNHYYQEEKIIEPKGQATFLDDQGNDSGSMTRNINSGNINDINPFILSAFANIAYDLPLNHSGTLLLSPGIGFRYDINNIIENYNWLIHGFTAGLSLYYSPELPKEPVRIYKEIFQIDSLIVENDIVPDITIKKGRDKTFEEEIVLEDTILINSYLIRTDTIFNPKIYDLSAGLELFGIDSLGNEYHLDKINIEEFHFTQMHPLLNYIFFDENSSDIPSKYLQYDNSEIFNIKTLNKLSTLEIYYNILNILGYRLQEHSDAKIIIVGCNNAKGRERGNRQLSRDRANNIKKYLEDVWGISSSKIDIKTRGLPENPSTPLEPLMKKQENQRVEIYSDNPKIFEPFITSDFIRNIDPLNVKFKTDINAEAGLKYGYIKFLQNRDSCFAIEDIQENRGEYPYRLSNISNFMVLNEEYLQYYLYLRDKKYNSFSTVRKSIPLNIHTVRQKKIEKRKDKEIEKYNLILFDFNSADIKDNNENIINHIKARIKDNSKLSITGFTDKTGDENYNLELSLLRAEAAFNNIGLNNAKYKGIGNQIELFDNSLPEGRFYSRTVEILIENPIEY